MKGPEDVKKVVEKGVYARHSGDLFARLMEVTKDEAQRLVRNEGQKLGRCGFWAMRKLKDRYNPRTQMKLMRSTVAAVKPKEAKTLKDVEAAVDEGENGLLRIEQEYQEKFSDPVKTAILISIVPEEIQDKAMEMERGNNKVTFEAAKEVVVATTLRKLERKKGREGEIAAFFLG